MKCVLNQILITDEILKKDPKKLWIPEFLLPL